MKTEDQAWRQLQQHAAAQLHPDFSQRVLRAAHGPAVDTWQQLQARGASSLRPGFAERVLRAARHLPGVPSFIDQIALGAATAGVCLLGVLYVHSRSTQHQEEINLARWEQLAAEVQEYDVQ
ncbi:hypothetical protein [Opitutus sp. ER46]|uniref:hypothetical protein n=1 Tax=Opitutus sp. ER46 TaxID=2161864 RepID=UPI000D314A8D|nr:hypothetical protein [Opitutus sp. ER46]PTY01219.1 hypothetical protein DB354_00235 [Opitutus sp. ER46]